MCVNPQRKMFSLTVSSFAAILRAVMCAQVLAVLLHEQDSKIHPRYHLGWQIQVVIFNLLDIYLYVAVSHTTVKTVIDI